MHPLLDWIPYKLIEEEDGFYLEWIYLSKIRINHPFFDETISKCRSLDINSKGLRFISSIESFLDWAQTIHFCKTTSFIFHISRCGSTLLSQQLAIPKSNIMISEAPIFDQILRHENLNSNQKQILLVSTLKFLGQRRFKEESHLFVKLDSWHLMYVNLLREMFPKMPFFILYRNPVEVLNSHLNQRGMHMVPGLLPPKIFQFNQDQLDYIEYPFHVLEKYFRQIIQFVLKDKNIQVANYNKGMDLVLDIFSQFVNIDYELEDQMAMKNRLKTHSKNPKVTFTKDVVNFQDLQSKQYALLQSLYEQLLFIK